MKYKYLAVLMMASLLVFVTVPFTALAQDMLDVPTIWDGSVDGALRRFIEADTNADGTRKNPNRVYRLERGGLYWMDASQPIKFNLTMVAEDNDPANPTNPPCLVPTILGDGSSVGNWFDIQKGNLTLRNIIFKTIRPDFQQVPWNGSTFNISGDSIRVHVSHCVFEYMTGGQSFAIGGKWSKVYLMDNIFRNGQHPGSWFGGGASIFSPVEVDTCVLTNNTMFYCGGYLTGPNRNYSKYVHIEHNTVFVNHVNPLYAPYVSNAVIKNNIWYSTCSMGVTEVEREGGWFDWKGAVTSTISIDTIATDVATNYGLTESGRHMWVYNNAYYWPQAIKDMWARQDTVIKYQPSWMNTRTAAMFADDANYPHLLEGNNVEADPGFGAAEMGQVDSMAHYAELIRTNTQTNFLGYFNPGGDVFAVVWPVPENLAYSNTMLQTHASDGLPVGDLNWFPDKRKQWAFVLTGVAPEPTGELPQVFALSQNYPNPFNPTTKIEFSIPQQSNVELKVYNILGQEVASLVNETMQPGRYVVPFDASKLASGMYIYKLRAGDYVSARKMMLLK